MPENVLSVIRMGNPILREIAKKVKVEEIQSTEMQHFIDDLICTMRKENGAGIAAPQVGKSIRVFVMECDNNERYPDVDDFPLTTVINPTITKKTDAQIENWEGCLSIPGIRGQVARFTHVTLKGLDRFGRPFEKELTNFEAVVAQHEMDHLNGVLFVDRLKDSKNLAFYEEYLTFIK